MQAAHRLKVPKQRLHLRQGAQGDLMPLEDIVREQQCVQFFWCALVSDEGTDAISDGRVEAWREAGREGGVVSEYLIHSLAGRAYLLPSSPPSLPPSFPTLLLRHLLLDCLPAFLVQLVHSRADGPEFLCGHPADLKHT